MIINKKKITKNMKKLILIAIVFLTSVNLNSQDVEHNYEESALYKMSCFKIISEDEATYKIYQKGCEDFPIIQGIFFINEVIYLQYEIIYTIEVETYYGTYYFYDVMLPKNSNVNLICEHD